MPPTCDRQWCIRQITRDARSPARGRTPEDQIAGAADHRSHRAVKPKPERHERDPSRHLLRGCTKFWQLTLTPTRRKVRSPNEKFLSVVAPAAVPFTPQPRKEHMFTRAVELTSKSGKSRDLSNAINEQVVPMLKKQAGFVDEIVLVSDAERDRVLALSFWKTREDAERYHREQYNTVREKLQHLIDAEPVIRTFDVHTSTGHKIAAGKAA